MSANFFVRLLGRLILTGVAGAHQQAPEAETPQHRADRAFREMYPVPLRDHPRFVEIIAQSFSRADADWPAGGET